MKKVKGKQKKTSLESELKKDLLAFKRLKDKKKILEATISDINEQLTPLEGSCHEQMLALDCKKITIGTDTYSASARLFFSMGDKAKAIRWIKTKFPKLLSVNAQTLSSFLKERVEQNQKIPKFFNRYSKEKVSIRSIA